MRAALTRSEGKIGVLLGNHICQKKWMMEERRNGFSFFY